MNEKRRLCEPFREPFGFVYFGAIVIGVNTQCSAGENKLEAKAVLSSPVTVKRTNTSTQTTFPRIHPSFFLSFFFFSSNLHIHLLTISFSPSCVFVIALNDYVLKTPAQHFPPPLGC